MRFSTFRIIIIFLILLSVVGTLSAQADEALPVILLRGPTESLGLPLGFSNSVLCQSGIYTWGDYRIEVFFTDIIMELGDDWSSNTCGRYDLVHAVIDDETVFYYSDPRGWGVFLSLPILLAEDSCQFISPFIERFSYFQSISDSFSFPAVLEITVP